MPEPDRWVVIGVDKYGEPFEYPTGDASQSKAEAEDTVRRMNKRGGDVSMHREVWDWSAAAYRRA